MELLHSAIKRPTSVDQKITVHLTQTIILNFPKQEAFIVLDHCFNKKDLIEWKKGQKLERIYLYVVDFDKILVQIVLLIEALHAEIFRSCT